MVRLVKGVRRMFDITPFDVRPPFDLPIENLDRIFIIADCVAADEQAFDRDVWPPWQSPRPCRKTAIGIKDEDGLDALKTVCWQVIQ